MQERKDTVMLHFLVLIWGFTAILGALINLPSVELVFFRTFLAAIGLLLLILFKKNKSLVLPKTMDYWSVLGLGVVIAGHWIFFFLGARMANISVCLAGMATCAMWTSILEPIIFKRKIKLIEVILGLISFIGMSIIFNVEFDKVAGFLVALASALLAAIFSVFNGKLTHRIDPYVITFYEMTGAFVSIALFFPFYAQINRAPLELSPSLSDWGYLLILASICTVFAFSYSVELMKRLSPYFVNLTTNLEPVYGILLALMIFPESEKMTFGFYLGTALILVSVISYPIFNKIKKRKAYETDLLR